ncbi:hypothetical protein RN04_06280 [Arthrobacter sp. W1]|nr:hypothetical protein RN04_06280 [Arthrobacter sp. W1]
MKPVIHRSRRRRPLALAVAAALLVPLSAASPAQAAGSATEADPGAAPGQFTETNLGADRTEADFFYRIPALLHLGDGVVLASWDARPGSAADAPNPNSIVQRRSTDNGKTWGPMTTIAAGFAGSAEEGKYGYSDPSYVHDQQTGKVFAFFVYSKDQGFHGSTWGNDDENRQVISAAVVESSDGGLTWSEPRLITDVVKPGDGAVPGAVRSTFATSGAGIQLSRGEYAGRLIQQYAGDVMQPDGSRSIQAYSVYSDDHGATWQRGEFTGSRMDENKVVELSDGRVMLNSRDSAGGGYRKVAVSEDGGHSYSQVSADHQLPDPTNNAHITQLHPGAEAGSAEAKKLLYTGANSKTGRQNVSARVSCDDGQTWPGLRTIRRGFSAYSVASALDDGQFGVFYEGGYTDSMQFASFDEQWLNYVCAPLAAPELTAAAGEQAELEVTIANQEDRAISGTLALAESSQATAEPLAIEPLEAGQSRTVALPVDISALANGTQQLQLVFTEADGTQSQGLVDAQINGQEVTGIEVTGQRADSGRDVATDPYAEGEKVPYSFTVKNTGNINQWVVPTEGNFAPFAAKPVGEPSEAGNCRYSNLAAGASYQCTTPRHAVTAEDMSNGYFTPQTTWTSGKLGDYATVANEYRIIGDEVDLLVRAPGLEARAGQPVLADLDDDGYASAGDTVSYEATVQNTGNVRLTGITGGGIEIPELAAGQSATATVTRQLQASDIEQAKLAEAAETLAGNNGAKQATAELVLPALDLPVQEQEEASGKPGKAVLSHDNGQGSGLQDGDYTITMDLRHGSNATEFILYENGEQIARQPLAANGQEAQQASVDITGRANGTYKYQGVLRNAAGQRKTAVLAVKVTDAAPGAPKLSAQIDAQAGTITVSSELRWGTNATSYQLFENGKLVDEQRLDADTPNAQQATTVLEDRAPGTYRYRAAVANAAGSTDSKQLVVRVK